MDQQEGNLNPLAPQPEVGPCDDWGDDAFAAFVSESNEDHEADEALSELLPEPGQLHNALAMLAIETPDPPSSASPLVEGQVTALAMPSNTAEILPAKCGTIEDTELAEAYLQDASRGVASMEQAIINYESQRDPNEALAQVCRELHTLKGASAIAGLEDLARYLHDVEDLLQTPDNLGTEETTERMLECVDAVRRQIAALAGGKDAESTSAAPESPGGNPSSRLDVHPESEDSICVKASQLDRLMDMVAALVMLRNQRESRVEQLRVINDELARCGSRLRELERSNPLCGSNDLTLHSDPMTEVANDLSEISRALRESYEPVAEENLAVSSFIRQFRQALVKLLRTPVSGLFRRLQRAALDAARVEGKRVRLQVVGSDTGLERSVQERLFDPLLHIVRNAVSHGIELAEEREAAGKDAVGTITLEATGTPNLLVITVRDDGRGLDYEALRRRGIELGILTGDRAATPQELAQLIFRPGFSTRTTANEIAGRGVGMDVVANTLDRMHSWVEVESNPGQGTTVRLTVPLRSIIEHSMVFRAGEQLHAVPMQYIKNAGSKAEPSRDDTVCSLGHLLGSPESSSVNSTYLVVEAQPMLAVDDSSSEIPSTISSQKNDAQVTFQVDEIVGPEEVVVRPLPPLFRHQTLFAGVTLSGNGQIVLVLDPRRLIDLAAHLQGTTDDFPTGTVSAKQDESRVLVVDDSLSARRAVSMLLRKRGWDVVEAVDGTTAIERLQEENFVAVFTDFDMPRMDGLQLIRAIRDRHSTHQLPVVMLSSRAAAEMEEAALNEGASRYLRKPITEEQLDEILATLMSHATPGESR